ncbi:PAS domain S-box protein [Halorhabdus rudnickae]|uniref:PAS domain S-box protein n=1 Tax=Halorhabdus rudnickae TaxID=1775544 RepID=UPI001082F34F|nr:PAS domain S-box protein [Halorhabdus rudnickae]
MALPGNRDIFDSVADGLLIHCPDSGEIVDVNERFCAMTGFERDAIIGESVDLLMAEKPPFAMGVAEDILDRLRAEGTQFDEWKLLTADGTTFPARVHISLIEIDGEERVLATVRDITELRESETQLQQFRRAIEATGHAVYITDTDGTITYVNPAFETVTGYDRATAIGETPEILDSGVHDGQYFEALWSTLRAGEVWEEEIINERASGQQYHAEQTIAPIEDDAGDVQGYVAIQTDVTERERQADRIRAMLEHAMAIIAVFQPDGTVTYVSPSIEQYLGYAPSELEGQDVTEIVHPEDREALANRLRRVAENPEEVARGRARFRHADGSWRVFESVVNSQLDNPAVEGIIINARDITERADRGKHLRVMDRLLRHNMRNDMTVVLGMADHAESQGDAEVAEAAAQIRETVTGLLDTVEKEREIVEVLSEPPERETIDLVTAVENALTDVTDSGDRVSCDLLAQAWVRALPSIDRAISELVDNALVYADADAATVAVTVTRSESTVRIRVADEGPPIPDEEVDAFKRSEIDALNHGQGLGLWLVNWIVDRSGGDLSFDRSDDGNLVTISLPAAREPDRT